MSFLARVYAKSKADVNSLPLVSITERECLFQTGTPVTFKFVRNTQSSTVHKIPKHLYQQDIEPYGKYMLLDERIDDDPLPEWEKGEMHFNNPIVLKWSETGAYDQTSWKYKLYEVFNKKGKALSNALKALGYDGIVTVDKKHTSEILQLL